MGMEGDGIGLIAGISSRRAGVRAWDWGSGGATTNPDWAVAVRHVSRACGGNLLSELANRGHRLIPLRLPAVSVVINGVDDGFSGFELGLKGGSGHGWLEVGWRLGFPLACPHSVIGR